MRSYLVVGNQTLGSDELRAAVQERLAAGPCRFHVVAPATLPRDHLVWSDGEAIAVARRNLDRALTSMRADGADVDGAVGDSNPVLAVIDALAHDDFDEVVLSTFPPGVSRWIRQDLPHRLARRTILPLCHIVSQVREPEATR